VQHIEQLEEKVDTLHDEVQQSHAVASAPLMEAKKKVNYLCKERGLHLKQCFNDGSVIAMTTIPPSFQNWNLS